jgi:hypothetical protein
MLGHHWYKKGKDKRVIWGMIIGAIVTVLPFLLKWGVWWNIGQYDEVVAGGGASFWQPPFFYGWLVVMSYFFIITILTGIWLKKKGSKKN